MEEGERTTQPATIGELRQRLRSMGEPWAVPARFSDVDPLPELPYQPVSPGHVEGLRALDSSEEFEACLREVPPSNPFLAARWRDLGVAVPATPDAAGTPATGQDIPEWGVG